MGEENDPELDLYSARHRLHRSLHRVSMVGGSRREALLWSHYGRLFP